MVQAQPLHGAAPAPGLRQAQPVPGLHRAQGDHPVRRARRPAQGQALPLPAVQQGDPIVPPGDGMARQQLDLRQELGPGLQDQPVPAEPGGDAVGQVQPALPPRGGVPQQVQDRLEMGGADVLSPRAQPVESCWSIRTLTASGASARASRDRVTRPSRASTWAVRRAASRSMA